VSGAVGDTWAFLVTGFAQSSVVDSPFPGMTCYVPPWSWSPWRCLFPVAGHSGLAGDGRLTIPYTIPAELAGVTLFHQAYVADPAAPDYFVCTGGLQLGYGQ
jgi:hypothetical protein